MLQETQVWNDVADCVEAYLSNAQIGNQPDSIDNYLPDVPGPCRNLAIIELAKIEMEQNASMGILPSVDEYIIRYPELAECTGGVPLDLILEEIRLRLGTDSFRAAITKSGSRSTLLRSKDFSECQALPRSVRLD